MAPATGPRLAAASLLGVVLIALFVYFFVTPVHDPKPNGLPVVVVGPAGPAGALATRLEARDFKVLHRPDAPAARRAIDDRDAYGAFILSRRAPRVLVATAASYVAAQLLGRVGSAAGVRAVVDVKPTDPDDPRGATLNVLVLALVITAILTALAAVQLVPELRLLRPRIVATGFAAIAGGAAAIGIVQAEGAVPGPYFALVAIVALGVMGIALTSSGLIRLAGPAGAGLPFLIFLMLGNPASGLATAPELLPTPWHPVGSYFPPGALGSALRGVAYFDGAKIVGPLLILAAYVALGLILNELASRRLPRARLAYS
jgi:hypothetical protein